MNQFKIHEVNRGDLSQGNNKCNILTISSHSLPIKKEVFCEDHRQKKKRCEVFFIVIDYIESYGLSKCNNIS